MNGKRPYMDYRQHRAACRLVHECCNYDNGNCLVLDDSEPCVCVQSISYSLLCRWFISAVLPLDWKLEAALLHRGRAETLYRVRRAFSPQVKPGEILPELRRTHEKNQSRTAQAETEG